MSACQVTECGKPVEARGWCHRHYECWRRTGAPVAAPRVPVAPMERFRTKYDVQPNGCWLWTAARDGNGYGLFYVSPGRRVRAHIYAWCSYNCAEIPSGLQLDHFACDTPACVNPKHVRPVTVRENTLRSNNACARNLAKRACKRGHAFTPENTILTPDGRRCRECTRLARERRRRAAA